MERLTYFFRGSCQVHGADNRLCKEVCDDPGRGCPGCPINEAFLRLAAYEDTGLTPEEIRELKTMAEHHKEGRLLVVPCHGEVLYEADRAHGVVKHIITDLHWMVNTMAQDDNGMAWADYYTDEEIGTAYGTREAAEAALTSLEG